MTTARRPRLHPAWTAAAVAFVALVGAAGLRATPGVLIEPLHHEFGWSTATISVAVSVNLLLFGLTVFMTRAWQLIACWGVLVGLGTGSMALVFGATVANRWFTERRGVVIGILTAGGAAGLLVFLPLLSLLVQRHGWRTAALTVSGAALLVVPLVAVFLRERPSDLGLLPYGATVAVPDPVQTVSPARAALDALHVAARTRAFWLLAGGFAICGATTNGLVGTHFIPAAHDHGMGMTTAASLLRGLSLFALPVLFAATPQARILLFVVFYGLDWVATVPPTVALCRQQFSDRGTLVFGWVFASHQVGAAVAAGLSVTISRVRVVTSPAVAVA